MTLTLTINERDYGFVIEAIKLRTMSLIESLDVQKYQQENPPADPPQFAQAPVKQEGQPVEEQKVYSWSQTTPVNKKPHWTQTAKGKKIMAARKRKGTK